MHAWMRLIRGWTSMHLRWRSIAGMARHTVRRPHDMALLTMRRFTQLRCLLLLIGLSGPAVAQVPMIELPPPAPVEQRLQQLAKALLAQAQPLGAGGDRSRELGARFRRQLVAGQPADALVSRQALRSATRALRPVSGPHSQACSEGPTLQKHGRHASEGIL